MSDGPAAQRLEAFLEGLPRSRARTQALIDYGTVLRDSNDALRLAASPGARHDVPDLEVERLRTALVVTSVLVTDGFHAGPLVRTWGAPEAIAAEYARLRPPALVPRDEPTREDIEG